MALTPGANYRMSGSLTTPKFTRLAIIGHTTEANGTSKAMVNIIDWYCQTSLPGGLLSTFLTNFAAAVQGVYLDVLSSTYTLDRYTAKYLDNPLSIVTELAVGVPGTVVTDRSASFNASVFQKKTTVPSRNYRGSMHIGALPESFTTTDHINATGLTPYNALGAALQGLVTIPISDGAQQWFPIVVSSTLSDLFASPALVSFAAITEFYHNVRIGTMRRRKERSAV